MKKVNVTLKLENRQIETDGLIYPAHGRIPTIKDENGNTIPLSIPMQDSTTRMVVSSLETENISIFDIVEIKVNGIDCLVKDIHGKKLILYNDIYSKI